MYNDTTVRWQTNNNSKTTTFELNGSPTMQLQSSLFHIFSSSYDLCTGFLSILWVGVIWSIILKHNCPFSESTTWYIYGFVEPNKIEAKQNYRHFMVDIELQQMTFYRSERFGGSCPSFRNDFVRILQTSTTHKVQSSVGVLFQHGKVFQKFWSSSSHSLSSS